MGSTHLQFRREKRRFLCIQLHKLDPTVSEGKKLQMLVHNLALEKLSVKEVTHYPWSRGDLKEARLLKRR
jgi:hypothetical protein